MALYLLAERNELFLAKFAEESLKRVDGIMGFIAHYCQLQKCDRKKGV